MFSESRLIAVRTTEKTAYKNHKVDKIRVVHPPHPLLGVALDVVRRISRQGVKHWLCRHPDGGQIVLPKSWTVHADGHQGDVFARGEGVAATALRDLLLLLESLVSSSASQNTSLEDVTQGAFDERAIVSTQASRKQREK